MDELSFSTRQKTQRSCTKHRTSVKLFTKIEIFCCKWVGWVFIKCHLSYRRAIRFYLPETGARMNRSLVQTCDFIQRSGHLFITNAQQNDHKLFLFSDLVPPCFSEPVTAWLSCPYDTTTLYSASEMPQSETTLKYASLDIIRIQSTYILPSLYF